MQNNSTLKRHSIQGKFFVLIILTIIFVSFAFICVSIFQSKKLTDIVVHTNENQDETIFELSGKTMDSVVRITLNETTQLQAHSASLIFKDLMERVNIAGNYLTQIIENSSSSPEKNLSKAYEKIKEISDPDSKLSMQILYDNHYNSGNSSILEKINLMNNFPELLFELCKNGSFNSFFVALPEGICIVADYTREDKTHNDGSFMLFPFSQRQWYTGAVEKKGLYISDVEKDYFSDDIGIVCSIPVYKNGKLFAIIGADLYISSIAEHVEKTATENGFIFIINSDGQTVFAPKTQTIFSTNSYIDLRSSENTEFAQYIADALNGNQEIRIVKDKDSTYYMSASHIDGVNWTIIAVINKDRTELPAKNMNRELRQISNEAILEFRKSAEQSKKTIVVLLSLIISCCVCSSVVISDKIARPLNRMTESITNLSDGNFTFKKEKFYNTGDEVEVLASAFADLSERIVKYVNEIKTITAEAERIGTELRVATQIQANMLPTIFPDFSEKKEFDLFASMHPAKEVGGDFYDFFFIDEDHLACIMADVSGKGVPAALFMVIAKTLIKNKVQSGAQPAQVFEDVNNKLIENNKAELFVTAYLAIINIKTGSCLVSNAGHEHPVLKHGKGKFELVKYRHSPVIGIIKDIKYEQHSCKLDKGDTLFIYTDGVPESCNKKNKFFGTEGMIKALNASENTNPIEVIANVQKAIKEFSNGAEQFDDITMLCFRYNGTEDKI